MFNKPYQRLCELTLAGLGLLLIAALNQPENIDLYTDSILRYLFAIDLMQ